MKKKKRGINFMTPNILKDYDLPNGRFAELSEGEDFDHQPMYGVTVFVKDTMGILHDYSKPFHNKDEALAYIEHLSGKEIQTPAPKAETITAIYHYDNSGKRDLVGITDDFDLWLKHNNEQRINDGEEPESANDFELVKTTSITFN